MKNHFRYEMVEDIDRTRLVSHDGTLGTYHVDPCIICQYDWLSCLYQGNRDAVRHMRERIDHLYMGLNADARGEETDFDGEPIKKWNRLVNATATAFCYAVAKGRWAVVLERAINKHKETHSTLAISQADTDLWDLLKESEPEEV